MVEIKKHIESRLRELAKERIMYLVRKVQPRGYQTWVDLPFIEGDTEIDMDITEICNWLRLYFGESMRPKAIRTSVKIGVQIDEPDAMVKYDLDESAGDRFKVLAAAQAKIMEDDDIQSALNPFKCNEDRKNCERVTWSQLNIDKPLVNNQRLQALGMIELEVGGSMLSKNPADYDYLLKDGNVVCLLPVDDRQAETPLKDEGIPWNDLDVEQAAAARNLVSKALKTNPTIRDLAMHNYTVEDGKVTGLVSVEEVVSIR